MNYSTIKPYLATAAIVVALVFAGASTVYAGITYSSTTLKDAYVDHTFFAATTTSATSTNGANLGDRTMRIDGAKSVALFFGRGGATGPNIGTSTFRVQVSRDGTEWFDYNTLVQNVATSAAGVTIPASISIEASTSTVIAYMQRLGFHFLRCIVLETIDGEHTCRASATF